MREATTRRRGRSYAASMAGVLVLAGSLAACTGGGYGGGGGCAPATEVHGGYPLAPPNYVSGWYSSDTRTTGNVQVNADLGAPAGYGCNSVKLVTGNNIQISGTYQDKAQLFSYDLTGVPLSTINNVSYYAYKSSASAPSPVDVSINIQITGSIPSGFTFGTLVYEPYNQSTGNAGVHTDEWQFWDATAATPGDGVWWSSKIAYGNPGSQSSPQPLSFFKSLYSDAVLAGYGFNVGSNNPNQVLGADGLFVGTTLTDF